MPTVGSLFTGIGGLDLGLERAGWTVRWQSEIDRYATRVLAKHWPHVPNIGDVTRVDWNDVEPVDLICGGYPCQPFSLAGKRDGTADARHLWPYFADAIRNLRPRWALLENVPGHLSMGFGSVLADLAASGYNAQWDCIPASALGAPHIRYRVFVVAHTSQPRHRPHGTGVPRSHGEMGHDESRIATDRRTDVADTDRGRQQERAEASSGWNEVHRQQQRHADTGRRSDDVADTDRTRQPNDRQLSAPRWTDADTSSDVADTSRTTIIGQRRRIEQPTHSATERNLHPWETEPDVGRVADGVPARVDRLRCLGNAVVPQVAEWIGHLIYARHMATQALQFGPHDDVGTQAVTIDGVTVGTITPTATGWITKYNDGSDGPTGGTKLDVAWNLVNS